MNEIAPGKRIFANKDLHLGEIEWVGFDLDYTLAIYKNPTYEAMTYDLLVSGLIGFSYPPEIRSLKFDPSFIVLGLLLDTELGNVIQLDRTSSIVMAYHGRTKLPKAEIKHIYHSSSIAASELGTSRYVFINTSFSTPEMCLFCDLVDFFDKRGEKVEYLNIWLDMRVLSDKNHKKDLKDEVLLDVKKYITRDSRDPHLRSSLTNLSKQGKKLFLLTNSPWYYASALMSFILNDENTPHNVDWLKYFDVVIADANKPNWFMASRTAFREIDIKTGYPLLGPVTGFQKGVAYHGGCLAIFEKLAGIKQGNTVLYVGDHIFSDVMISKKKHAWRTLLILPELDSDVSNLEKSKSQLSESDDSLRSTKNTENSLSPSKIITTLLPNDYFGSALRHGVHQTFFSMQVGRYADLYTSSVVNIQSYPPNHRFVAPIMLLPHERAIGLETL